MTEILEPGRGKSSLDGGSPVIVMDNHERWLYGWSKYYEIEKKGLDHKLLLVKGIRLGVYVAFLEIRFPEIDHLVKRLIGVDTIHASDLEAIDRAITLTQRHANELEAIQARLEAHELEDKHGNPIPPDDYP